MRGIVIILIVSGFVLLTSPAVYANNYYASHKTKISQAHEKAKTKKADGKSAPASNNSRGKYLGLQLYQPTYVLPFYYTFSPYESIYKGHTPDNQRIQNQEFKAQLSFQIPLWENMFHKPVSLHAGYTQLMYWQFYAKSQYFRETNYMPELFLVMPYNNKWGHWTFRTGGVHQSNGRGGSTERSWNRLYVEAALQHGHFFIDVKPWVLIFKGESSDLHNPNITDYLGHGRVIIGAKFWHQTVSIMLRNTIASGFRRGATSVNWSFPIHGPIHGFVQYFQGYGQSLIEYDHYTNALGVGITLNNYF